MAIPDRLEQVGKWLQAALLATHIAYARYASSLALGPLGS
jgi:hypothetical protein